VRSTRLDRYFVYTSLLGTHSFFLIFLPVTFWLGSAKFARGLVNVLAFGVYLSSAVKDALCIPRPYSPPVTRLVIGTTHLEYGFLSTHSTNCSSVALYFYLWLGALRSEPTTSQYMHSWLFEVLLVYYVISVVYGRIYAGMHSVMGESII
jgi:membrane-associated phospholipid phosphatase